jgi:hypothetical protein
LANGCQGSAYRPPPLRTSDRGIDVILASPGA